MLLIARIAGILAALAACAWFALAAVQAGDRAEARRLMAPRAPLTDDERERVERLVDRSDFLRPGVEADMLRAEVAIDRDDLSGAARILEHVVRREPENINAWVRLALVYVPIDEERAERAKAQVLRLSPPVPAP